MFDIFNKNKSKINISNNINVLDIKIKKVFDDAIIPNYAYPGEDAGLDLVAARRSFDDKTNCWVYDTGIALEIPKGYVGLIFPRSSNAKTDYYLTNSVGIIDSGYRGSILLKFKHRDTNTDGLFPPFEIGNKVGQLIIIQYPIINLIETNKLSKSSRNDNGYGSTGK